METICGENRENFIIIIEFLLRTKNSFKWPVKNSNFNVYFLVNTTQQKYNRLDIFSIHMSLNI